MIEFNVQNVELPTLDYDLIREWLNEIATRFNKKITNLVYLFCNDDEILRVNRQFLGHDYFTDIITFDYSYKDRVGGDLFISLDTVWSNARELRVPRQQELLRVIVHGLLHLCGVEDKGPGEREIMEHHENEALALYRRLSLQPLSGN